MKSIKYFYGDKVELDTIIKFNQSISEKRFPIGKELQIVLSLNFADWFLCSTAESWTSCLDLKSSHQSAFWASLPGLIIDKNRALVYITDGTKKEFCGITTDKFITRSWILLNIFCSHYAQKPVCDYYKRVTSTGTEETGLAQFDNECVVCHWYGSDGVLKTGKTTTTDLGYTEGECTQGIYQK